MGQIVPDAIEQYLADSTAPATRCSTRSPAATSTRGLPLVDAEVGALLRVLATSIGASRILEIGTAIGYSGIWLAGALPPGGMLVTMEFDEERAREARENFARAGLGDRVSVVVGDAQLKIAKVVGPVRSDLPGRRQELYTPLLDRLVALLRPGGLLVTDNVLWDGEVVPGFQTTPRQDRRRHAAPSSSTTSGVAASPGSADEHRPAARRRVDLGQAVRLKPDTTEDGRQVPVVIL